MSDAGQITHETHLMDGETVGIDLGTTFSVVAYVGADGKPRIIEVEGGNPTLASVVLYEEDGRIVVGEEAMLKYLLLPDRTIRWIKRDMGHKHTIDMKYPHPPEGEDIGESEQDAVHSVTLTPPEISAKILEKLKQEASGKLGKPVTRAVITCPAWYDGLARDAVAEAGRLAGLEVLRIIEEPTAAAVYWGLQHLKEGEVVLVYDLGGGTFDCSILRYEDGQLNRLATQSHQELGGYHWTQKLMEHAGQKMAEKLGEDPTLNPEYETQLQEKCERAKRFLQSAESQKIVCTFGDQQVEAEVLQSDFESWTEDLVQKTLMRTENAINLAGLGGWEEVTHLLLVGGSTRLRRVRDALKELSGKEPIITGDEDTMVALGAAMLAAEKTGQSTDFGEGQGPKNVKIGETAQRSMGFVTLNRGGEPKYLNSAMIKAGSELPCTETRVFKTSSHNQKTFKVPVIEGEEPDAMDNFEYKTYEFDCLPDTPRDAEIEVTFEYNESNQIDVNARDARTGTQLTKRAAEFYYPQEGGETRTVDLCFVVDATASMGSCIRGVKEEIGNFTHHLSNSDFSYRLSLVVFRDLKINEPTEIHNWTEEVTEFRDWVSAVKARGGGDLPESALDGLVDATQLAPRPEATPIVVLITDAPCHVPDQSGRSPEDVARMLTEQHIKVVAVTPDFPAYRTVVEQTGGKLFDFNKQFRPGQVDVNLFREVLQDVSQTVIELLTT